MHSIKNHISLHCLRLMVTPYLCSSGVWLIQCRILPDFFPFGIKTRFENRDFLVF